MTEFKEGQWSFKGARRLRIGTHHLMRLLRVKASIPWMKILPQNDIDILSDSYRILLMGKNTNEELWATPPGDVAHNVFKKKDVLEESYAYIANPYTPIGKFTPAEKIMFRHVRFRQVCRFTATLASQGEIVFSPIIHGHVLHQTAKLPTTWDYWWKIDKAFLLGAEKLMVLTLPGWEKSVGVKEEIIFAIHIDIPIEYVDPCNDMMSMETEWPGVTEANLPQAILDFDKEYGW